MTNRICVCALLGNATCDEPCSTQPACTRCGTPLAPGYVKRGLCGRCYEARSLERLNSGQPKPMLCPDCLAEGNRRAGAAHWQGRCNKHGNKPKYGKRPRYHE